MRKLKEAEEDSVDSDDVWMEEVESEVEDPFRVVNPSILDGTDGSDLIETIKNDISTDALQRLQEEQKNTYGSRRPLVKWWLDESEEERARSSKGGEL